MNPLMEALVSARVAEEDQRESSLSTVMASRLRLPAVEGDKSQWPVFEAWCLQNGIRAYPARPASVAFFILDNKALGIEELRKIVAAVSVVHQNVADPTLGPAVAAAFDEVAPIEPPRSWPKEQKYRFLQLPYELQVYVGKHEQDREKAIRRAHNEVAQLKQDLARRELAAIQQPKETHDGIQQIASA